MDSGELAYLRRARDLLDREYAEPLNVALMARAALMSPSHFSRRFREAYGETPYGYLQTRRVERAMALLRRGDLSVTDVCMAVGFTSLGSFSSTFTRLVGEPPSAYRARVIPGSPRSPRASLEPGPGRAGMEKHGRRSLHKVTTTVLPITHTPVYCLDLDESRPSTPNGWASSSVRTFPWARTCAG